MNSLGAIILMRISRWRGWRLHDMPLLLMAFDRLNTMMTVGTLFSRLLGMAGVLSAAVLLMGASQASPLGADEMTKLLKNVQQSAQTEDYAGIITHNNGKETQSMYLVHIVDGKGERERLVLLDGVEREFLRENEITQCLLPNEEIVIQEPSRTDRFPGLLHSEEIDVSQSYQMTALEQSARVAGRECQMYQLTPIDDARFGYQLCIDKETSLLLQMQTLDEQGQLVLQVAFASVDIGAQVDSSRLESPWDIQEWRTISADMHEIDLSSQGWRIPYPAGFEPIKQVVRSMPQTRQVAQMLLSDGLAAISVFIEPVSGQGQRLQAEEGKKMGGVFLHRTQIGENWLTLTGEVPLETLQHLGQQTQFVPLTSNN